MCAQSPLVFVPLQTIRLCRRMSNALSDCIFSSQLACTVKLNANIHDCFNLEWANKKGIMSGRANHTQRFLRGFGIFACKTLTLALWK